MLNAVFAKDVSDLTEHRARTPNRDAKIVQKLGVEIGLQARLIALHDVEQGQMNLARADISPHVRCEIEMQRRDILRLWRADVLTNQSLHTLRAGSDAGTAFNDGDEPFVLSGVPA